MWFYQSVISKEQVDRVQLLDGRRGEDISTSYGVIQRVSFRERNKLEYLLEIELELMTMWMSF